MCLQKRIEGLADRYGAILSNRDRRLFTKFLPEGYRMTTLQDVDGENLDRVLFAKINLGMLITLCDDLADNPAHFNPPVLRELYRLELTDFAHSVDLRPSDFPLFELGGFLMEGIFREIEGLPHFPALLDFLSFYIKQIFLSNQYSELLMGRPHSANLTESKHYGPYNMGMVAAGMIDLMANPGLDLKELGKLREVFIKGQRVGRIANVLSTLEREILEGDGTSEIIISGRVASDYSSELLREMHLLLTQIQFHASAISSIDLASYYRGLLSLHGLHLSMKGVI